MSLGFHCVFDRGASQAIEENGGLVDVVAVHDIGDNWTSAWTDTSSGVNWIRQLLPQDVSVGRIVLYNHDAKAETFFGDEAHQKTQRQAESFVQDLAADRKFAGTLRKPLVFVCHGLGGVLVKKSLAYSATRTSPRLAHLRDQYISTFAIIFFGTPHGRTCDAHWVALENGSDSARRAVNSLLSVRRDVQREDRQVPQMVDIEFLPLSNRFRMFLFWEALPTALGREIAWIVPPDSATMKLDHAEVASVDATHANMTRFGSRKSSTYRTIISAIERYCESAPTIIKHRWTEADRQLRQYRAELAWELAGLETGQCESGKMKTDTCPESHHFYPPERKCSFFVGRQKPLMKLRSRFFPNNEPIQAPGRKSFVIYGIGGSGKTELSAEFAEVSKNLYSAVFTIQASSKDTAASSFAEIGRIGGMEPTENSGRHFLSQIRTCFLLIIDNADNPQMDIRSLFPASNIGHIIITTRCPNFTAEGELGFVELKDLEPDEALQLLLEKAGVSRPWDAETQNRGNLIARTLGYLALALIHAGTYIFEKVCELKDFLEVHKEARDRLRQKRMAHKSKSTNFSSDVPLTQSQKEDKYEKLYSTFDMSLETLSEASPDMRQDASDILRILSFFHFERVPIELFSRAVRKRMREMALSQQETTASRLVTAIRNRLEPSLPLPAFLRGGKDGLEKYRVNHAVAKLRALSLVSFDGYFISLHPLAQAWIRDGMSLPEQRIWAEVALQTLMQSISLPPEGNSDRDGQFHRDILPHLRAWLAEFKNPISPLVQGIGPLRFSFAKFLQPTLLLAVATEVQNSAKCGWVFAERGLFADARFHLENTRETLTKALGRNHEKTMTAMVGLAGVYWGLGRLDDAIGLQQFVMREKSKQLGASHEQTLQVMNHLGRSYWLNGQYNEALDTQLETVGRMKLTMGPTHPNYQETLGALDTLGVIFGAWRRFEESRAVHQEVLEARQILLGESHSDTLVTKANLAMALLNLQLLDKARELMTEVYQSRRQLLGSEHPWTLWALCYLAKVHTESGNLGEAEEMLSKGIEAGIRSLDTLHLGVLMGRGELARIYARQGRLDEAESLTLEVMAAVEKSRGPDHPDCVYVLLKAAQLYLLKGCREKALEMCKLGLRRSEVRITRVHPLSQEMERMVTRLEDASSSALDISRLVPTALQCKVLSALSTSLDASKPAVQMIPGQQQNHREERPEDSQQQAIRRSATS